MMKRIFNLVTPPAGVWIETVHNILYSCQSLVTPPAGVWIETYYWSPIAITYIVTPPAGVWIETLPSINSFVFEICHSPCGSVD